MGFLFGPHKLETKIRVFLGVMKIEEEGLSCSAVVLMGTYFLFDLAPWPRHFSEAFLSSLLPFFLLLLF